MDAQSPPTRVTRARAAAKTSNLQTSDPAAKSTRIVTAAAKARTTRATAPTATATRTAIKRKSPCDEDEDEEHQEAPTKKMPAVDAKPTRGRGRPRKVAVEAPAKEPAPEPAPAATVRTRGRPKKAADPGPEPVMATRTTRTKKTVSEDTEATAEPIKKTTRGRPALSTSTTTSTSRALAKPAVKKTVKFEEPEKENIAPTTKPRTKSSTTAPVRAATAGLRGKPLRKAATATTRTARSAKAATNSTVTNEKVEKPMPLSPKKVNQLTLNRVESDDELGMDEKNPVRRFKKAPIKLAGGKKSSSTAKIPVSGPENDENAVVVHHPETEVSLLLATPAKRLPPSPWKGSLKSPARRVEGLLVVSVTQTDEQACQASAKRGLLQSPAKRQPLNLNPLGGDISGTSLSPVKLSFLSSPAKRPISPIKPLPLRIEEEEEPVYQSPAPKPTLLASPSPREVIANLEERDAPAEEDQIMQESEDNTIPESPTRLNFPGRLSAILPRDADPTLTPPALARQEEMPQTGAEEARVEEAPEEASDVDGQGAPMVVDNPAVENLAVECVSTTPPASPPKTANPMFDLRAKDLNPYDHIDSESEDESPARQSKFTSAFSALPATPCPASAKTQNRMQSVGRSTSKRRQSSNDFGFTPLAHQLSGWTAGSSPLKTGLHSASHSTGFTLADVEGQPAASGPKTASTPTESAQNTFFEDEMLVRPEAEDEEAATDPEDDDDTILEDVSFSEEDIALAAEANEMSLNPGSQDPDDTISEASQEYADENAIPIDPTLFGSNAHSSAIPPVTPQRVIHREVHTVAKVPLKPADDSIHRPKTEKRSYSASRLPAARPTERLTRNATVISYSPTKGVGINPFEEEFEDQLDAAAAPVTPQKDIWSTIGTPAQTPRRDLNPGLLRGAVVFVDVHTSEGADASGIFVELLTLMGARCVKNWSWNPNNSSESGGDPRVGITHVVYKDGGKRTLEKVRESAGLVQCVGVSWVLDCERENQWLEEAPYYIDTAIVPRGGARRRKSMEPRAIANMNGMLVPSPVRNSRGSQTAPSTPTNNRRASALWIRTPDDSGNNEADHDGSDNSDDDDDDVANDPDWTAPLTPVPKTPAPETIARFVANISPGSTTPSSVGSMDHEEDDDDMESRRQEMLMRTCPPKRAAFVELGEGILSKEKDERVLMRLMAARRKSLQFAPKVGSPLAKAWKAWN
ncbi:hypothetical protein VTI74DRAFT_1212 [Chaetomium olivicolor]